MNKAVIYARYSSDSQTEEALMDNLECAKNMLKEMV